jgi:hypothetical protein
VNEKRDGPLLLFSGSTMKEREMDCFFFFFFFFHMRKRIAASA